ncbi:DNA-directed RNA polymerase subunit beta [Sporosarcina sp. BI001-red]|uniref:DNA-directed RNA polymerase subunit beta n=1 Tax=Sporosarcina sp. BI001-red TaxID=2282866 RepID=UPI000E22971B|nr:DNA-directed RNA polymerase subunit beta [Sporosarcina sp. BI001-red]REB08495.1 DNA-directed RNA polymerase subunit beta [Sporosarcina sp. BI001-red]
MTDEKRNTSIPSHSPSESDQPAVKTRSEARAAHAATAQSASDSEHITRSKRKVETKPVKNEEVVQKTRGKRIEKTESEETTEAKPVRWVQVRILPIYVRVILVIVLLIVASVVGALIGYSILGDGTASGIFQKDTWAHIFDIMSGKEK